MLRVFGAAAKLTGDSYGSRLWRGWRAIPFSMAVLIASRNLCWQVRAHFKGGNIKVVKFLDTMVKAKQLDATSTKSKKNKDVTNYKVK
jgi:hypothetical protein